MHYTESINSKSGKQISILIVESSLNPKLTLIESHGGFQGSKEMTAQASQAIITWAQDRAINYISIDLSNNGTQPNQPFNELRYSHRVKDLESTIDFVTQKYHCPVILIGSSLGGLITLNAATYSPQVIGIILNCAAVKAHECVVNSIDPTEYANWQKSNIATVWGVPMAYDFYQDLVDIDAMKVIPQLKMPILWFHGTKDITVPIQQAETAQALNSLVELIKVQGGGHRFGDKMAPGEWETKVFNFISNIVNHENK